MRPDCLSFLFSPLSSLSGIGEKHFLSLEKLVGPLNIDLLFHLPRSFIHWRTISSVNEASVEEHVSISLTVISHKISRNMRHPHRVVCRDIKGNIIHLVFFRPSSYVLSKLKEGSDTIVRGKLDVFNDQLQITHPHDIQNAKNPTNLTTFEPIYPLHSSLTNRVVVKAIDTILNNLPPLLEWIPHFRLSEHNWPSFAEAIHKAHRPLTLEDTHPLAPHRQRLAYDEALAHQLSIIITQDNLKVHRKTNLIDYDPNFLENFSKKLPFTLTKDQKNSILDILNDISSEQLMQRLVQGDVGCGKTVVAFAAMIATAKHGLQAALMAPTETLVYQHYDKLTSIAEKFNIETHILTGQQKKSHQNNILKKLANGEALLTVGTHSLFQKNHAFHNLRLAVIDEQQRFGVHQRLDLINKGRDTDMLVLTATPIPRTLMMVYYGSLKTSLIKEKPPQRQKIITSAIPIERIKEVEDAIQRQIKKDSLIYWVCPLVEENSEIELTAVKARADKLAKTFGQDKVKTVHGKIKGEERNKIIKDFSNNVAPILVASTVIEVGIDVPEADVIVIEHAERFGLSQIHQLRGRVGRAGKKGFCILLYSNPLSSIARQRINIIRQSQDGFYIAEQDLYLRGSGDVLGTKQSGDINFRLLQNDNQLQTFKNVLNDIKNIQTNNHVFYTLLYLFKHNNAASLIKGG